MCFEYDFLAVVDGGSLDHGTPNRGYGSYHLANRDGRQQTVRLDLGTATNTANGAVLRNEAEYRTLISALKDLTGRIVKAGRSPGKYSVVAQTDSQLVVGQLTQGWQVKATNPSTNSGHACARWSTRQPPSSRPLAAAILRLRSGQAWSRCRVATSCGCLVTETEPDPLVWIRLFFFRRRAQ